MSPVPPSSTITITEELAGTKRKLRKASPEPSKTREMVPLQTPLNTELRNIFQGIREEDLAFATAEVTCRHRTCNFSSQRARVAEHEKVCARVELSCSHPGCSFASTKDNLIRHEKEAHVPCVWCSAKVPMVSMANHWKECDHKYLRSRPGGNRDEVKEGSTSTSEVPDCSDFDMEEAECEDQSLMALASSVFPIQKRQTSRAYPLPDEAFSQGL